MYLADLDQNQISKLLSGWGEPSYRAAQVFGWLKKGARPNEMTNIPADLRESSLPYRMAALRFRINFFPARIKRSSISSGSRTKTLWKGF
jgi:adenine C2-methylase RlmN of 23S rRNA A2503 and tRNA A37